MRVEVERIADQLKRAFEGDAWHGPAVTEALAEHDAASAAARVFEGGHTPCELALHIAAWTEIGTRRAQGVKVSPTAAEDWPVPHPEQEHAWRDARARIHSAYEALQHALAAMHDDQLLQQVKGKDHNVYVLLHGVVQHSLYHAGQIILLRRALDGR